MRETSELCNRAKTEADFRPGTPLNNTVAILKAPIDPRSTESPLLEHYYSMTLSQCYRSSGAEIRLPDLP